jgi:flagellar hook assembly protein FlgD
VKKTFIVLCLALPFALLVNKANSEEMLAVETADGVYHYSLENLSISFSDFDENDSISIEMNSTTESYALSAIDSIDFEIGSVDVRGEIGLSHLPDHFNLLPAYPNPFNPETNITVELPARDNLKLQIYNISGQLVATLADGVYGLGKHRFSFNAADLSSGIYFVNATTQNRSSITQKIILMK